VVSARGVGASGTPQPTGADVRCGCRRCSSRPPREPGAGRSAATRQVAAFDSGRAFEHIRQLASIGPRPAGSPGIEQTRRYIGEQIKAVGLSVREQAFQAQTPLGTVKMVNLSVVIPGASDERLLITGHYDTKLFRQFRFIGANDGGSSAAMLLELARVLKTRSNAFTIELVFFDGEEAVIEWTGADHTYGSRHYVEQARASGSLRTIRAMVLVDMVADRNLNIRRESQSTPWLTDIIWETAKRLGHGDSFPDELLLVADDHVPFLEAGVPSVDLIDLDYPAWHTADDTLDSVSARSLQAVGDVLVASLPRIETRLRKRLAQTGL
jgi:glutaminyl-peptide cyclotransferase